MRALAWPFIGSEALAAGRLRKHQLRAHYRPLFPNVYIPDGVTPTLIQRSTAAWLWTGRGGVIAGAAAAALHGARWIPDTEPVELVWRNARPPAGILTRRDRLEAAEIIQLGGLRVTSVARTAFDVGRLTRGDNAVVRLDALGNATAFDVTAVLELADRHPGTPGVARLRDALARHDPGAESPRETWLRLLLERAGYRRPRTQIPVVDDYGRALYYLDMGWEDVKVAVEYDGDHHRQRQVFADDIIRAEFIAERSWQRVRVVSGQREAEILDRVARAWARADRAGVRSDRRAG
jgi:very-short-patch-repair endonuclease